MGVKLIKISAVYFVLGVARHVYVDHPQLRLRLGSRTRQPSGLGIPGSCRRYLCSVPRDRESTAGKVHFGRTISVCLS